MQNGLLGAMSQPAAPQAPMGGLLSQAAAPQGDANLQMAQQLAQNPTAETAQMVAQQLLKSGDPEAQQIAKTLQEIGDNPQALQQFAEAAIQHLSSGQ